MPFLTLMTNLKPSSLPADLMPKYDCFTFFLSTPPPLPLLPLQVLLPRLVSLVAPIMSKPVPAFNWALDTDKNMSKVGQIVDGLLLDDDKLEMIDMKGVVVWSVPTAASLSIFLSGQWWLQGSSSSFTC